MDKTFLLTLNISFNIIIISIIIIIRLLTCKGYIFIFISYKDILLFPLLICILLYLINVLYNYTSISYHIFCKYCKLLTIMPILYDCRLFMPMRDDK